MDGSETFMSAAVWAGVASLGYLALPKAWQRLQLSMAKYPSLGGHLRMAKRVSKLIPHYAYPDKTWFAIDGAPLAVEQRRRLALARLGSSLKDQSPQTLAQSDAVRPMLSDLQLIGQYRVPYQFRELLAQYVKLGSFWRESSGVWLTDLDGKRFIDVTGSSGVNLFGSDFYKASMAEGAAIGKGFGGDCALVIDYFVVGLYAGRVASNAEI